MNASDVRDAARIMAWPTDAQITARALSRWEGEGGALGLGSRWRSLQSPRRERQREVERGAGAR